MPARRSSTATRPAARDTAERSSYERIYAAVRRIPRGRVASYGQVAALAGLPRHARLVGYALHRLPSSTTVPWHRVVNAAGRISKRAFAEDGLLQRMLLEAEGVRFRADGRVAMDDCGWPPPRRGDDERPLRKRRSARRSRRND